jgi:hypothetical protein
MHPLTSIEIARAVQADREAALGPPTSRSTPRRGVPTLARHLASWPGRLPRRELPFGIGR